MANQTAGFRSVIAPGLDAEVATQLAVASLRGRPGFAVHQVAPGRISVARTVRPPWATALFVLTVWAAGLGLLFLLVRRTEAGELHVVDGPRGAVVTLPPMLDAPAAQALTDMLSTGADPAEVRTAPPAATAAAPTGDLDAPTILRRDAPSAAPARPATDALPAVSLRFDAGSVEIPAGTTAVLGRAPAPRDGAAARVVPGDATTVSQAHLLVAFLDDGVTVQDLGSTNGSSVARAGGPAVALVPGAAVPVDLGDRVVLGSLACVVTDPAADAEHAPGPVVP